MADSRVSDLIEVNAAAAGDYLYIVSSGNSRKISAGNLTGTARLVKVVSTANIAVGANANIQVAGANIYSLYRVGSNVASRIRIYTDSAMRSNDIARLASTVPNANAGVVLDYYNPVSNVNSYIAPAVTGFNSDPNPNATIYLNVTNLSASANSVSVTLFYTTIQE